MPAVNEEKCSEEKKEGEEIPLEIEDYSCNTFFEVTVANIERYIVEEFRTRRELKRFLVNSKDSYIEKNSDCIVCGNVPVSSCNNDCGSIVFGRNFAVGPVGNGYSENEETTEVEGIAVEIHIQPAHCEDHRNQQQQRTQWHPIARLFALPLFFLARGTTTAPSYRKSESSFYLSLLTTAVGRAMRGSLSLRFGSDPSLLPSPFFYSDGTAPCFVSVGDHYQLAFNGVATAVMVGGGAERWPLPRLIAQPVVRCRFQCTAYPHSPEWCQHVSDYLDMFQLQIGPQSRVCTDVFDGICVSLQRTFRLEVPRHFILNDKDNNKNITTDVVNNSGGTRNARSGVGEKRTTISWPDVLELENEVMSLYTGQTTFPFGTGTVPLQAVKFFFQWSQIHDTEIQDDVGRFSNLDPFSPEEVLLRNKLTIKALALPKKECELNHAACKSLSEYAYMVMEYLSLGKGGFQLSQRVPDTLDTIADEIINGNMVGVSEQKALIDRLARHQQQDGRVTWGDVRNVYFPESLLCRFAYTCAERLDEIDDLPALWLLVVNRLRSLFESGSGRGRHSLLLQLIEIIGVPPVEEIDHGLPLLVQKLQLLSYCVRRMLSECKHTAIKQPEDGWDNDSDELSSHNMSISPLDPGKIMKYGVVSSEKYLITNGEPLVEPQAFPSPPCTSDVFMMKAQELQNLGTASAGQHARAWMQSTGLFNDMCLFLYVNRAHEGRVVRFPDFVQWHSPRDFVRPLDNSRQRPGVIADEVDDDMYLSERMRRSSAEMNGLMTNVWWPLWSKATPRSPDEIIAQSFVPYEQAQLILRWMEKDLSVTRLLLETVHANVSNSLHRLLSHRCMAENSALAVYALGKNEIIATSLKNVVRMDDAFINDESFRTIYSAVICQIGEIETSLCTSLAIERLLGASHGDVCDAPSEDKLCTSLGELVAVLSSPTENSDDLTLCEASLSLSLWHHGGIKLLFSKDKQQAVAMQLRATCMAERPLNTTACFQQMFAEIDETGVFRLALALAEEVF